MSDTTTTILTDRISEHIEQQTKRLSLLKRLQSNYKDLMALSDEQLRIMNINSENGYTPCPINLGIGTTNYDIFAHFVRIGEPLAVGLYNHIYGEANFQNTLAPPNNRFLLFEFLEKTDIFEGLLNRTMGKDRYFGLLNGNVPFFEYSGKEYFLPKGPEIVPS
jgi:hypothetical protein